MNVFETASEVTVPNGFGSCLPEMIRIRLASRTSAASFNSATNLPSWREGKQQPVTAKQYIYIVSQTYDNGLYIYVYICTCACKCVYNMYTVYIYIYTYTHTLHIHYMYLNIYMYIYIYIFTYLFAAENSLPLSSIWKMSFPLTPTASARFRQKQVRQIDLWSTNTLCILVKTGKYKNTLRNMSHT